MTEDDVTVESNSDEMLDFESQTLSFVYDSAGQLVERTPKPMALLQTIALGLTMRRGGFMSMPSTACSGTRPRIPARIYL